VLLEFLVKNGSERVVDDARSHIATIKILRNFHYIDEKAKDQGINGTPHPTGASETVCKAQFVTKWQGRLIDL